MRTVAGAKKTCLACKLPKPRTEFTKDKHARDGLKYYCKTCVHDQYVANREDRIARVARYQAEHPDETRATKREWYRNHRESEIAKYHERSSDPEVVQRRRGSSVRSEGKRRAQKRGATASTISQEELAGILEEYGGQCWICSTDLAGAELHWDHYQPLAKGGEHVLDNIRPACRWCNLSKHARWPLTDEVLDDIRRESERRRAKASD